ncbi:Alpha/Beta hydrolase protein [Trichoderma ceciliae]
MRMKQTIALAVLAFGLLPTSGAAPPPPYSAVKGQDDNTTVTIPSGIIVGSAIGDIEAFKGIPFADPPTGLLRLKPPRKLSSHLGTFDATGVANLCPQGPVLSLPPSSGPQQHDLAKQIVKDSFGIQTAEGDQDPVQSEDCLTVSVHRPRGTSEGDDLPVLFYIFGGGFMVGGTSAAVNNPTSLVQAGIDLGQPFIFAAINYRVAGWGFMPGAEILRDGSANAGLLDQRMGLEWVADNIAAFGGDPDKVTIWGQSSGAISVFDQLALYDGNATYNGKSLFRAAIMNSGSVTPADAVDSPKALVVYENVVKEAGCEGDDSLACLRGLSYEDFAKAANSVPGLLSYESLALSYLPRPDGRVLTASPHVLAKEGRFHAVPMILGTQEDEGTIFSQFQGDMGTTDKIVDYLGNLYFQNANRSQITTFVNTYSARVQDGSPYRTGLLFALLFYPGQKRIASILGDMVFTLIRRWTLQTVAEVHPDVPLWSSFASYDYLNGLFGGYLGTRHGSDTTVFFGQNKDYYPSKTGRTYYLNFVHNLDPNVGLKSDVFWPRWTEGNQLLWYNASANGLLDDDFRASSFDFMKENIDILRF